MKYKIKYKNIKMRLYYQMIKNIIQKKKFKIGTIKLMSLIKV